MILAAKHNLGLPQNSVSLQTGFTSGRTLERKFGGASRRG